jgi:hypothetical protein
MTFQIAFTVPEGIILASDRKKTSVFGIHHSRIGTKIQINESETLAYCHAGDSGFCEVVASIVQEELEKGTTQFTNGDPLKTQRILLKCVNTARQRETGFIQGKHLGSSPGGHTLFVFRQNDSLALWAVDSASQIPDVSLVVEGQNIKAGDANSPAVFFPHWYFDKVPNTIGALIPLAVHTVLMAKADYIEGVEVGIFTKDTFRTLTEEELKPHIKLSKEIDSTILAILLNGKVR